MGVEKKYAYLRKLNITGLRDDERIRIADDYRNKNSNVKILVKGSKEKIKAEEEKKRKMLAKEIRNYFICKCARTTRKEVVLQSYSELGIARVK